MLVFIEISKTTGIYEADAVIFGAHNRQLAGLVPAFRQPGEHFGTLGAPWGTMGAAERIDCLVE